MTTSSRVVMLGRILCPTDFSDFSATAVSYAAALAATYGATLRLLHVTTPFPIVVPYASVPGDQGLFAAQTVATVSTPPLGPVCASSAAWGYAEDFPRGGRDARPGRDVDQCEDDFADGLG